MIKTVLNHFIIDKCISTVLDGLITEFMPYTSDLYTRKLGEYIDLKINDLAPITCKITEMDDAHNAKLLYETDKGFLIFHVCEDDITFVDGSIDIFADLMVGM